MTDKIEYPEHLDPELIKGALFVHNAPLIISGSKCSGYSTLSVILKSNPIFFFCYFFIYFSFVNFSYLIKVAPIFTKCNCT